MMHVDLSREEAVSTLWVVDDCLNRRGARLFLQLAISIGRLSIDGAGGASRAPVRFTCADAIGLPYPTLSPMRVSRPRVVLERGGP